MTWTAYQVSFRLLSPMHIGWRKLGNLQQTRPYVTGRSLWGALTARLTREFGGSDYPSIGKEADAQLIFTYFYPSSRPDSVSLWPWSDQWDEFAWTFLGSYASTALENGRYAEAGSLHETEYIAPYTRNSTYGEVPTSVYLVGYIFQNDNSAGKLHWQEILRKLQFGGERGYGWGRVDLEHCEEIKDGKCFDYELSCQGVRPQITVPEGKELLAHTIAVDDTGVVGTIEPLVGRETKSHTSFGKSLSNAEVCWVPGGKVTQEQTFQIHEKGIWKR